MGWIEDEPREPGVYMLGGAVIERRDIDSTACWAAVGWGGLRSWSAITSGVPVGTPVVRLVPVTDRDKLAQDADRPSYRLPDWLGGHEVLNVVGSHWLDGTEYVKVDTPGGTVAVMRSSLVEVRPPSIDDPVTLPLVIDELDGVGEKVRTLHLGVRDGWTILDIYDHRSATHKRIRLNVGSLRALARAAWRRSFEQAGESASSTVDGA